MPDDLGVESLAPRQRDRFDVDREDPTLEDCGEFPAEQLAYSSSFQLRKILEHAHQVSRQRHGELHSPLVPWMCEGKALGVQERPFEAQNGTMIAGDPTPHAAIHRVADDGMSDGAQVNANLMGSSRVDGHLAQRDTWKMTGARDARHRARARAWRARTSSAGSPDRGRLRHRCDGQPGRHPTRARCIPSRLRGPEIGVTAPGGLRRSWRSP